MVSYWKYIFLLKVLDQPTLTDLPDMKSQSDLTLFGVGVSFGINAQLPNL